MVRYLGQEATLPLGWCFSTVMATNKNNPSSPPGAPMYVLLRMIIMNNGSDYCPWALCYLGGESSYFADLTGGLPEEGGVHLSR